MEGWRKGTGREEEEVWFSVVSLESISWISGVPDFNLKKRQRENRGSVRTAATTSELRKIIGQVGKLGERREDTGGKGPESFMP